MGDARVEMVQPARPAEGDRALAVGRVVPDPEVAGSAAAARMGLGPGVIGDGGSPPADRPVRPLLVVERSERVELSLQRGEIGRRGSPRQPALERLVIALDLALGLRVSGGTVLPADPEPGEQVLEAVAPPGEARGVDRPVVGERRGRPAMGVTGRGERGDDVVATSTTVWDDLLAVAGWPRNEGRAAPRRRPRPDVQATTRQVDTHGPATRRADVVAHANREVRQSAARRRTGLDVPRPRWQLLGYGILPNARANRLEDVSVHD